GIVVPVMRLCIASPGVSGGLSEAPVYICLTSLLAQVASAIALELGPRASLSYCISKVHQKIHFATQEDRSVKKSTRGVALVGKRESGFRTGDGRNLGEDATTEGPVIREFVKPERGGSARKKAESALVALSERCVITIAIPSPVQHHLPR